MKLLIIGKKESYECQRLVSEAKSLNYKTTVADFQELIFDVPGPKKDSDILLGNKSIKRNFDTVYIRQFFPYISEALFLAEWAHRNGLRAIDRQLATNNYIQSKMYNAWKLAEAGLPVVPGFQAMNLNMAKKRLTKINKPIIAKGVHGSQGKYVFCLKDPKIDIEQLSEDLVGFFTFQDNLNIEKEYRILVICGKYFGSIKKTVAAGEFRNNISLGATAEPANITPKLKRLSEQAAKIMGYEFAGIDLAISKNNPFILEVNRCPGFSGFEKATGLNVAKHFLKVVNNK